MSLRLSRVLGDIGITRQMVNMRRNICLLNEKASPIEGGYFKTNLTFYHFGSQSEGTTTLGMDSDIDFLSSNNDSRVLLDWSEWQPSPQCSFLVLQDGSSPPQHCNMLLYLRPDLPLPATVDMIPNDINIEVDIEVRMFIKNTVFDSRLKKKYGADFIKQGPSRSMSKYLDFVAAYHCARQPKECQFLFHRPRPGHWPTPDILEQAKQTGTFLVPQGHAESCHPQLEWRFSTSIIERLLMFNLNMTKLKAYTFLKILRKSYIKPVVGDRLSTFHFKTALLFTIESYPPEIWQEYKLLHCVILCLTTLKRWCRMHYCPHYTISGVDLFVGKLRRFELAQISAILSDMIENTMSYVVYIEMDGLGRRMLKLIYDTNTHIKRTRSENILATVHERFSNMFNGMFVWKQSDSAFVKSTLEKKIVYFINFAMQSDLSTFSKDFVKTMVLILFNQLASSRASMCLELHQPVTADIYNLYHASQDSDLTASRLKFASMLYCTDQYEEAATMLNQTEDLLHPDVWHFNKSRRSVPVPSKTFLRRFLYKPVSEIIRTSVAFSVSFHNPEVHCVPKHLVFEIHRTINQEDKQHRSLLDGWMDTVITDSAPFLYYIQYLTYRQLGQQDRKLTAMRKLRHYINHENKHPDTAANMLGHCFELENKLDLAWTCYSTSLKAFRHNNAAKWHIMMLLYKAHVQG